VASGWLWLNLALTLTLIPTALICLEFLACEQVSCSPGRGDPGRFDRPGDRFVSVFERMRARQLAKAGRGQIPPCPRVHCCAYISREVFLSPATIGQVCCVLPLGSRRGPSYLVLASRGWACELLSRRPCLSALAPVAIPRGRVC